MSEASRLGPSEHDSPAPTPCGADRQPQIQHKGRSEKESISSLPQKLCRVSKRKKKKKSKDQDLNNRKCFEGCRPFVQVSRDQELLPRGPTNPKARFLEPYPA